MGGKNWKELQEAIEQHYGELRSRLVRILASEVMAEDVLQELYLRVRTRTSDVTIENPDAYLMRMAVNIANDLQRVERRNREHVIDLSAVSTDTSDLNAELGVFFEARDLEEALKALTPRRRQILIGIRLEGMSQDEVAKRLRISRSLVQKELRAALDFCVAFLEKKTEKW